MEQHLTAGFQNPDALLCIAGKSREFQPRWQLGERGSGLLDLPLGVKIPLVPGTKPVFCRTKLGEKLHQPSAQFNLGDPYCRLLRTEYNCLHDPHLQAYYNRKDNLQSLKSKGYITSDGKVVCTLKEFNEYRQYLTTLKLEAEKTRRQGEEKLQQELAKLKKLDPRLTARIDSYCQSSSTNVYMVMGEKASPLEPKKPAGPPSCKSRRNLLQSGQYRRLKAAPSGLELGREDAKLPGCIPTVTESERKSPVPADGVFKAASEEQAAKESQRIEEMARTVVRQVFERVQALDQSARVLKRAPHKSQERLCGSAKSAEPSETSPLDKEEEIALLAKKVVASVMKLFEKSWESGTPSASEPRPAARQKEQPVARTAFQVGKLAEKKSREAFEGESSQASLDKVTREAVGSVCDTLESFVASRFEQDFNRKYSEILALPTVNLSNRKPQPSQVPLLRQGMREGRGLPRASEEQSPEARQREKLPMIQPAPDTAEVSRLSHRIVRESTQKAVSEVQRLHTELQAYARTIVLNVVEKVKDKMEREMKAKALDTTSNSKTVASGMTRSVSEQSCQPGTARNLEKNLGKRVTKQPVPSKAKESCPSEHLQRPPDLLQAVRRGSEQGAPMAGSSAPPGESHSQRRSESTTGTIASMGPQFVRQPVPPSVPKHPVQGGARCPRVRVKPLPFKPQ
ncbi:titin homolog [Anser cygnoides]|uniref:titin homolog n=1 Tax=Anser cygnoides TaxID=8845 RepID=UPI0034D2B153